MDKVTHEMRLMQWKNIVRECRSSGMGVRAWCLENNVNEKQFYYWQRRIRKEVFSTLKKTEFQSQTNFVQLPIPAESSKNTSFFKVEGLLSELSSEERQKQRQLTVKPLVEAFFAWARQHQNTVLPKSETGKGFTYCINQEKYLKVFLENGNVLADNNVAESSIRGFCIGKRNWHLIDTIDGAKASAIIYSVEETAKANNLKPYNYFELLLTEIPKHMEDTNLDFLDDLLPWSEKLPVECKKQNQ